MSLAKCKWVLAVAWKASRLPLIGAVLNGIAGLRQVAHGVHFAEEASGMTISGRLESLLLTVYVRRACRLPHNQFWFHHDLLRPNFRVADAFQQRHRCSLPHPAQ